MANYDASIKKALRPEQDDLIDHGEHRAVRSDRLGAVLSRWFDRQRGLAIGIAMAGVGLGVALVPQIVVAVLIRV